MRECSPSIDKPPPDLCASLYEAAAAETQRYKWIESEKAGRDLGEWAIRTWIAKHWNGFLRARWLEHLQGNRFWYELTAEDFGRLRYPPHDGSLFGEVVSRFKAGGENLEILCWAHDQRREARDQVVEILIALNINSLRMKCKLLQDETARAEAQEEEAMAMAEACG